MQYGFLCITSIIEYNENKRRGAHVPLCKENDMKRSLKIIVIGTLILTFFSCAVILWSHPV